MFRWKNIVLFIFLATFGFVLGMRYRLGVIPTDLPPSPEVAEPAMEMGESASSGDAEPESPPLPKLDITGRINILILGEDNVQGSRRSDTILLAALDIDNENIRVLSIPRDTRVHIPRHGYQKINHAYAYGKEALVRSTLQKFLGIPVHYYAKIDYDNFPRLVDAVGGVEVYVGKAMRYTDRRGRLDINIPAGRQTMNGETALKYVRFRHDAKGDIGRVQRQQQFMKALIHKIYKPENLMRIGAILEEVQKTVDTDMAPSMIIQLGYFVQRLDKKPDRIFFMMLPGSASLIDNLSYWVSDRKDVEPFLTADISQLKELSAEAAHSRNNLAAITDAGDYDPDYPNGVKPQKVKDAEEKRKAEAALPSPKDISAMVSGIPEAVAVLNGTGKNGVGQSVASRLQKMGVDVAHVGNAKHFDYKSSNVIYPEKPTNADKRAADLLSKLCGISPSLTRTNSLATYPSLIVGHDYETLIKRLENSYAKME
jgi:LCP family protein required for cell wall assembly